MSKIHLLSAAAFTLMAVSGPVQAFGVLRVTEDAVNGFIGAIPTSVTPVIVASDGEAAFHPFGLGFDVSDAISLNGNWAPDPAYARSFGPNGWQQAPGTFVWYLAACNKSGCENAPIHEPRGKWIFTPGAGWGPGAKSIVMYDTDGKFSDLALIANDGPGGAATVLFQSGTPEPASWAMLIAGFGLVGAAARRRRLATIAA